jgi:methylenetetrahydrofolate dehydrogenase (NADP+)/methenyltetrahydrofolate cyclohydrolase
MAKAETAKILDGKSIAEKIRKDLRQEIIDNGITPGLAVILVGDNTPSMMYVNLKEKASEEVGINFSKYLANSQCYQDIDERELTEMIEFLNKDESVNGIVLQLPLPKEFDQNKMVKLITKSKDADGFHNGKVTPPTIASIIELLKATETEKFSGLKTLILGKADIFMTGLADHLKKDLDIKKISSAHEIPKDCDTYDIIIIALGSAHLLKKNDVKKGAIVIDVGINKVAGQTVGDVDPEVAKVAGYLSPVPGGVGPLTVACLLRNVFELAKKK